MNSLVALRRRFPTLSRLLDLYRIQKKSELFDGSFAGEFVVLEKIAKNLEITDGFVLDIAASDGYSQSSTLGFYQKGFYGLAVEMDPQKFSTLAFLYSKYPNVKLSKNRVTPGNIVALLDSFEVGDIAILNLDIDSYDLSVILAMLRGGYFPKIISMEINEKIPTGIYFVVEFSESHYWQGDHFYGCSLDAACLSIKPFGYSLVQLEYNNAFFVRNDVNKVKAVDLESGQAYKFGYQERSDRKTIFPWNQDVECWLELPILETIDQIHNRFQKYQGRFSLRPSGMSPLTRP